MRKGKGKREAKEKFPSYNVSSLLSTILHLAANARIMRLREVDFGPEPEYTSFDDRVTTFRFVSRVKRPLFAG